MLFRSQEFQDPCLDSWVSHSWTKYTLGRGWKGELFKGFQGGALRERLLARGTGQEIDGFSDGHGDTKIEAHAFVLAGRTGHLLEPVGDIRLCPQVELHIRVNGEAVVAFFTDATPFTICLHKALIDSKA